MQNKIVMKDNLFKRGVLGESRITCALECGLVEIILHVLLEVWYQVLKWFGVSFTIHDEILENVEQFFCLLGEGEL